MDPTPKYDALMEEVCAGMGWCGSVVDDTPMHVDMFIPESGPVTADQFVDWLFKAEGFTAEANPATWRQHRSALRAAFVRHMGSEVVDATSLKWSAS